MKAALRVLSIATIILWIFVGAFIGLIVYSALQMKLGEISVEGTFLGRKLITKVNASLFNGGYFDITDIDILTRLHMPLVGVELNRSSTSVPAIRAGEEGRISHEFVLDFPSLLERPEVVRVLLLNSTDLELILSLSLTYAVVFKVKMDVNTTMPWGAFLSGFRVREYEATPIGTEIYLVLNITFKNDAGFGFNFWLKAFDETGTPIGESSPISISVGDVFEGRVSIPIPLAKWTGRGWVNACIDVGAGVPLCTEVLTYG